MRSSTSLSSLSLLAGSLLVAGCDGCDAGNNPDGTGGNGAGNQGGGGSTGQFMGGGDQGGGSSGGDPVTCEQALDAKTYIGCEFWPTVTANNVWSIFDYAVVVANGGTQPAEVTVDRGGSTVATATVAPNSTSTLYLPWVPELKGPDFGTCTEAVPLNGTARVASGAYHLVSSLPVTVYQFNALEYGPQGGPPGKDWSSCPASQCFFGIECFSYSNDASLLLPAPALTGNYRVIGYHGWDIASIGATVTVTGTQDGTNVTATMGGMASLQAGGGLGAAGPGQQVTFTLNRGEVVQLYGAPAADFSGSLIQADKPVQVIHGLPCTNIPDGVAACDHIEESVFPAETLGEHYFVTAPTHANGGPAPYLVRMHGNVDGTTLTYPAGAPPNAPTTLNAGQVVDMGVVQQDFEVIGDKEFAVALFQTGADQTGAGLGDPAQSIATAVEQYRTKYVFLAPFDYDVNYVDIVMPLEAVVTLDGAPIGAPPTPISSGFGIARVTLPDTGQGAHIIASDLPVGIQVSGYGSYTSFQYPGGLNLDLIAPPPPPPQ
ncbi:MAG: IgGFc-binding protein [Polyangiaceae bacterium]|nr:IgGFc-binding protein [Polyangiaceae bacterium]MBK8937375.1 IgGFc-binding protein [Polyangiaceae bacterium]